MTVDEGKKAIEEMKAQGNSPEDIAGSFYLMFIDGKIDVEQLDALVNLLGYHLTDEFKNMSPEEQKTKGFEEKEPTEPESETENQNNDSSKGKDEDEDEETKAMKLFGMK